MKLKYILIAFSLLTVSAVAQQTVGLKDYTKGILQSASVGVEYRMKAGFLIGGTLPLPFPPEIREIANYNPLLNLALEAEVMKTFTEPCGLSFGLRLETKGMETDAQVKTYSMSMVHSGDEISGMWTGMVKTKVDNSYLTMPVLAVWKPSERWGVKCGIYGSYLLTGEFSGSARDGYLREGSPIGEKIEIDEASYDFSRDLQHWNYGLQVGGEFRAFPHLIVGLDLTYGLNNIFRKNFKVITYKMYPIYGNLNFGYAF
jgi:hypothetical protein